jgi:hypothetical protein
MLLMSQSRLPCPTKRNSTNFLTPRIRKIPFPTLWLLKLLISRALKLLQHRPNLRRAQPLVAKLPLLRVARHLRNLLQALAQPHQAEAQHARLQPQDVPHGLLRRRRAVEAQHEEVAHVVPRAALGRALGWVGHGEHAPVGDAADHAAALEDERAGCAADAVAENGQWLAFFLKKFRG